MKFSIETDDQSEAVAIAFVGDLIGLMRDINNVLQNQVSYGDVEDDREVLQDIKNDVQNMLLKLGVY